MRRKPIFHEGIFVPLDICGLARRYTDVCVTEDVERNEANGMLTMGELLKLKSEQGVVVLVHVWDEALSMDGSVRSPHCAPSVVPPCGSHLTPLLL